MQKNHEKQKEEKKGKQVEEKFGEEELSSLGESFEEEECQTLTFKSIKKAKKKLGEETLILQLLEKLEKTGGKAKLKRLEIKKKKGKKGKQKKNGEEKVRRGEVDSRREVDLLKSEVEWRCKCGKEETLCLSLSHLLLNSHSSLFLNPFLCPSCRLLLASSPLSSSTSNNTTISTSNTTTISASNTKNTTNTNVDRDEEREGGRGGRERRRGKVTRVVKEVSSECQVEGCRKVREYVSRVGVAHCEQHKALQDYPFPLSISLPSSCAHPNCNVRRTFLPFY